MKIALLTLQYDNNYGGNLQRFALMTILQKLGHNATNIHLCFKFFPDSRIQYLKNIIHRILLRIKTGKRIEIFAERNNHKKYIRSCQNTLPFLNRYIKHTKAVTTSKQLARYIDYDAFIVGSDQVWRKKFTKIHGIDTFFFNFLPTDKINRIAYGVSFGSNENELSSDDIARLTPLFNKFKNVSVRESAALDLLKEYSWEKDNTEIVLDPTLLLSPSDYDKIIAENDTSTLPGDVFCYVLDVNEEIKQFIQHFTKSNHKTAFYCSLGTMSVPQWLRSFKESSYIITDSYHGVLFSIIYNKPFHLFSNSFRGNTRFDSLAEKLSFKYNQEPYNWAKINNRIKELKEKSISFLSKALS